MMKNLYYIFNLARHTIFFRVRSGLLLLALIQNSPGLIASAGWQKSGFEWRPKSAVEVPRKNYSLLGGGGFTASPATLWIAKGCYMLRMKKNSWKKIDINNCDATAKKMISDECYRQSSINSSEFMINRLASGSITLRVHIPKS